MGQSKWSLEKELCDIACHPDVEHALHRLQMLPPETKFIELIKPPEWTPGGAETFIFPFVVVGEAGWTKRFLLKSITAFSGIPLWELAEDRMTRSDLLAGEGVTTPKIYGLESGTIIEEFIPHRLQDVLLRPRLRKILLESVLHYTVALAHLRFKPVDAFGDLRTCGRSAVPVDFGSDLGPPWRESTDPIALFTQLDRWIKRQRLSLPPDFRERYMASVRYTSS